MLPNILLIGHLLRVGAETVAKYISYLLDMDFSRTRLVHIFVVVLS